MVLATICPASIHLQKLILKDKRKTNRKLTAIIFNPAHMVLSKLYGFKKACPGLRSLLRIFSISILFPFSPPALLGQTDSVVLLAPARYEGMWGYINTRGEWVIEPQYGEAKNFHENLAEVIMYKGDDIVSGFINPRNELVIQLPELNYSNISEGMLSYYENGVCGFMDSTGKKIIPAQFKYCSNFHNGKAMVVFKSGKAGYINRNKQLLISPRWDTACSFQGNFAVIGKRDPEGKFKFGVIDHFGNLLIPPQYVFMTPLSEGKSFVNAGGSYEKGVLKGGKWYLINLNKQSVLTLCDTTLNKEIINYSGYLRFKNGVTWFPGIHQGKVLFGLMNENTDYVVLPQYTFVNRLNEDAGGVFAGRKMGFIDIHGKQFIPCVYDVVGAFNNGYAWFKQGKKYGYVDKKGDVIIPPSFDEAGDFTPVQFSSLK